MLLHLNPDLPTDPFSQLTIAQDIYVSNIVTVPIASDGGAGDGAYRHRQRQLAADPISFTAASAG